MGDLWGRLAEFARQAQAQRQPALVPPAPPMPWGNNPPVQYTPSTESIDALKPQNLPSAPPREYPLPDYPMIPPKTTPPQQPPISSRFGMPWTGRGPQPSLDNRENAQWPPPARTPDPSEVHMDPGAALDALNSLPPGHPDRPLWEAIVRQSAQGGR